MPSRTHRSEIILSRQKPSPLFVEKTKSFKYPARTECWFKQKEKQLRSAGCCSLLWSPLTTEATIWTLEHRLNTEEKSSQRHGHITLLKWRQSVQLIWFDYRAHGWVDRERERQWERLGGGIVKPSWPEKGQAKHIRRKVDLSAHFTSWSISRFLSNKWVASLVFPEELIE